VPSGLETFFEAYAARFNAAIADPPDVDIDGLASVYADAFIGANPTGVRCGANDDELRRVIPQGFEFYRSIGTKWMRVGSVDAHRLDDLHAAATVHWQSGYEKPDGSEVRIDFDVVYLVRTVGDEPRIFGFITGDEQAVLREHGLLPDS
jgi:hypothetical protein